MRTEPIPIQPDAPFAVPVGPPVGRPPEFQVALSVFEGPLSLLLHLCESRELDIREVALASVADAYVEHLVSHPVDAANLAQFVVVASQLIFIKSRSLLGGELEFGAPAGAEEIDEEELRSRLIAYRAIRDAARGLAARDLAATMWHREPRPSDLPVAPLAPLAPALLGDALERLAAVAEPEPPPPEIVQREVTVEQQVAVLRAALSETGRVVLQSVLAAAGSRTERVVTLLATLELIRRRELRARQSAMFGPILLQAIGEADR